MRWPWRNRDRRTLGLAAGGLLVVLASFGYLARAGLGHVGEPQAVMELTSRELEPEWTWNDEDSGLSLRWQWNQAAAIDEERLSDLGFDPTTCLERNAAERTAWGALELAGPGWRAWLDDQRRRLEEDLDRMLAAGPCEGCSEETRKQIDALPETSSRLTLVAVDAGRRPLAERYAGRQDVAVVPVRVSCQPDYRSEAQSKPLTGFVRLTVLRLHVPADRRRPVDRLVDWEGSELRRGSPQDGRDEEAPDFLATVSFGRHGVARLLAVEPAPD